MTEKKTSKAIWKTMMRRYTLIAGAGSLVCVLAFGRLYAIPPGQTSPTWLLIITTIGGLLLLGGLFGFALSLFFHVLHKEASEP